MVKEWTFEHIEKLIELYRVRPCLWKVTDANYTNKTFKNRAYEEIVNALKGDIPTLDQATVKMKLQNMRCSFRKELKKVDASERSGKGEDELYKPTLWYYELLHFTKDQERSLPTISNFQASRNSTDCLESGYIRNEESLYVVDDDDEDDEPVADSGNEGTRKQEQAENHDQYFIGPQMKKRTKELEKDIATFMRTCTAALDTRPTCLDDCSALGSYVSAKLRKMDESQQILAEALIQKVITRGMKKQLTDYTDLCEPVDPEMIEVTYEKATTKDAHSASYRSPQSEQSTSSASTMDYCCNLGKQ